MDFKKIIFKETSVDLEKALPDGVIICEKNGKIQWANDKAAEIFETSKMHLMTSSISDIVENALNLITNAVMYDKSVITKLTDREVYFSMSAKTTDDGYVLDFRDLSPELKSADSRVTHINNGNNQDKNVFLSKLANDFKSPLQSIVGFSQAMADGLGGNMTEQQDKYIRIIKKNSSELMYFADKLIELSKTETDLLKADYKIFDVINLVNSIVRYNEQLYKGKDLRWNVSIGEDVKNTIVSDETILKSILQNILEVILKTVDMGEIEISLNIPDMTLLQEKGMPQGDYLMINVKSSSLLLSENDLESMFDPYMIIDSSNRKNLLRAIMLASVRNMVQLLKGNVWVESRILKNTNFYIIIPQALKK